MNGRYIIHSGAVTQAIFVKKPRRSDCLPNISAIGSLILTHLIIVIVTPGLCMKHHHLIHIKLDRIEQLFNSLDPTPFLGRDLDPSADDFIAGWAEEHPREGAFKICIQLLESGDLEHAQVRAQQAVTGYYQARVVAQQQQLHRLFRHGRISLIVGITFLVACHLLSELLVQRFAEETLPALLAQGLIIAGWVALWHPLEIFLYEWWPLRQRLNLLRRLAAAQVEVTSVTPDQADSAQSGARHKTP